MTNPDTFIFLKCINAALWTCRTFSENGFCFDIHRNVTKFVQYADLFPIANNHLFINSSGWLRLGSHTQFSLFCSYSPVWLPHFHKKMFLLCFVIQKDSMIILMNLFQLEFCKQSIHCQITRTLQFHASWQNQKLQEATIYYACHQSPTVTQKLVDHV